MKRSPQSGGISRRTFSAGLGAAGLLAGTTPFNIVRAQGAALGLSGRHRPGLPARRRHRQRPPQGGGLFDAPDHERRHRNQCRRGALARGKADLRRRPAPRRRLRLRTELRDRAGGRAEGHSLRHQHRRGAADHRAGLQVRVPTPSSIRRRSSRSPARRRRPR